ncbi:uncharacterized protein LOC127131834 [Lathyrus oleraceus]|uniref:uncharacterized protein LOC127131834 n=1 Tax=Pisum sativum TaxID=3888 RepID=UPI0021CDF8BA|nr:uncharacterized protein LOC127131834 [Pisum sativum]
MKTQKGRFVAELISARKTKKTAGIGPSKSWSKVEVKKRKVREDFESEEDVEKDVPDISPVKKTTVRKSSGKVVVVHLDNISFHLEDGAAKWKFVIQRRVAVEGELGKDVVEVKECYEGLVKEFIVNIPEDIADKNNREFCKVFVRSKCITFSPTVINNFLGKKVEGTCELEATDNKVCREITARQVKGWPIKKHLPAGKLTVKYAILHKIGGANWVPTNHISTIVNTLGRFIFTVATKMNFDYDSNELPSRRKPALSVHYKLFEGSHIEDSVMTSAMKKPASKVGTIVEMKETCKELGEGIRVATTRKQSLEALIASLRQAKGENIDHAKEAEAHTSSERSATNDETSGNSISSADEAASSSSSN